MDPTSLSTSELAARIRDRRLSVADVVAAHLDRIERINPALNAIVVLDADRARARARAADDALAKGELWGPLHGVPFTLKDMHPTAGMQSSAGTRASAHVPAHNGVVAERLITSGGILLGKTNMAIGVQTVSELFGRTVNPYDRGRTTGGSSGGAAAAVAARLVPFDVGTDLSGSIRMPAHFCGVFGLKPTMHRIPTAGVLYGPPGIPRIDRDLGVAGPLTRSADDLGLLFRVLAGADPRDPEVPPVPLADVPRLQPRDLRLGFAPSIAGIPISRAVTGALDTLAGRLSDAGARVVPTALPFPFEELLAAFRRYFAFALEILVRAGIAPPASIPGDRPPTTPYDLMCVLDERDRFSAVLDRFLGDLDAFVCPPSIATAFPHCPPGSPIDVDGASVASIYIDHPTLIATYTGAPAVVVPVALVDGLPVGAQLIARRWQDERLIGVAAAVADVVGPLPPPPLA